MFRDAQVDVHLDLPTDVLRLLCIFASGHQPGATLGQLPSSFALKNTPELQAMGSCCKLLKGIFDSLRPSIHFDVEEQLQVEPYLIKLPSLSMVSISYSGDEPDIDYSLISLHKVLPGLTSLTLCHDDTEPVTSFGEALLVWSGTLQHLTLESMDIDPGMAGSSLDFLPKLTALTDLRLYDVFPPLETSDIEGCTSLVNLVLKMDNKADEDEDSVIFLDLSSCTALQGLDCTNYNLEGLNLTGLKALQYLDCSVNAIEELDVSTCASLKFLTCMNNAMDSLDVRGCLQLKELVCGTTPMRHLKVAGCAQLTILSCGDSSLEGLDLLGCTALKHLYCGGNNLSSLNLQPCPHLETLDAINSEFLRSLSLVGFLHLRSLQLKWVGVVVLDVTGCTDLESIECDVSSGLEVVRVTGCRKLVSLSCKQCPLLQEVACGGCDSLDRVSFDGSEVFSGVSAASLRAH